MAVLVQPSISTVRPGVSSVSSTTPIHHDIDTLTPVSLPSCVTIVSTRVAMLQHVPKILRNVWAGVVTDALSLICARPTEIDVWDKIFMLTKCILVSPYPQSRFHWRDTVWIVKERIN